MLSISQLPFVKSEARALYWNAPDSSSSAENEAELGYELVRGGL